MRRKQHKSRWEIKAVLLSALFLLASITFSIRTTDRDAMKSTYAATPEMQQFQSASIAGIAIPLSSEVQPETEVYTTEQETEPAEETIIWSRDWDGNDAEILMQIAMAEAEGEGVEGKAMVMLVVLNRVWSDGFPNSIEAVVFQKNQFSPVQPGGRYWTTTPDAECREALELVSNGWDESQGALFFEATSNTGTWHKNNLQYLFQLGNHIFYTTKEAKS